ncbi:MAG: DUF3800 domain-containing protein [Flavobacteriales bacterium]|nr:MAG: DUF3800 domain-containing protein [Flavobacteriales bacterium]
MDKANYGAIRQGYQPPHLREKFALFIDESGHAHQSNVDANNAFLTVCGVLFSKDDYGPFKSSFKSLKQDVFDSVDVVFHSRDIRKRQGPFRRLHDEAINELFVTRMNRAISESRFTVVATVIDKREFSRNYPFSTFDVYVIALEMIMERVLYRLQKKGILLYNKSVKIIAESRGKNEDKLLLGAYNKIVDTGNKYNTPERFQSLFTGITFKRKSERIDGLELADLCAYPISRHVQDPLVSHPSFPIIQPKLLRTIKHGYNAGIKRFPPPGTTRSGWYP